jgi:hypothetical protein
MALSAAPNCASFYCNCLRKPIDAHTLAPFVEIRMVDDDGKFITVGNKSDGKNNTAVIKSFSFGASNGVGAEVEIFDEEGGDFASFASKVINNLGAPVDQYQVKCKWGWIKADCNGSVSIVTSKTHYLIIQETEVNFSNGGLLFKLNLVDNINLTFNTRTNNVYGTDSADGRLSLKEAIKALFKDAKPAIEVVKFLRRKQTPDGGGGAIPDCANLSQDTEEIEFEAASGPDGPKYSWQANNQNPLSAARSWVMPYLTKGKNRGVVVFWDSTAPVGTLIFMEDPFSVCNDEDAQACLNSIGTFVVNGGKYSPVIQFSPSIKYMFSQAAKSGAANDAQAAEPGQMRGPGLCDPNKDLGPQGTGKETRPIVPDHLRDNWIYGQAAQQAARANAAQQRANTYVDTIEAELRIQGDPGLDDPNDLTKRTCSILVINPFHVVAQGQDCGDWLARPPCNEVLSNRVWRIEGVSHEIKEGSYTTTLKLRLNRPGTIASQ